LYVHNRANQLRRGFFFLGPFLLSIQVLLLTETDNAPLSWDIKDSWESDVRDLTWTFDDKMPRFRHERWREIFDDPLKSNPLSIHTAPPPLFGLPIGQDSVDFSIWLSKENIWKRYSTISHIAILEGEERKRTKEIFFDALNRQDTETDEQGRVEVHGRTIFAWTPKIPDMPSR